MLELRIAIQLGSLRQPFKEALDTAALLGAQAIEIDARTELKPAEMTRTAVRHIRKMLEDRKLRISSVRFPTRRGYSVADDIDRRVEATKDAMRMAYDLGAPVVVNHIGEIPETSEGPEWNLLLEVLYDLGRFSQKAGTTFAATTGSDNGERLRRVLDVLPIGYLFVDFDPAELIIHGFSPSDAIDLLASHVQVFRGRDAAREYSLGLGKEVQLGRGSVDFPHLLSKIEEAQYQGFITLQRNETNNAVFELTQSVEYLRNLWR